MQTFQLSTGIYLDTFIIVCRIKKVKKPESNVAAMIIRILLSRSSFRDSKVSLFSIMYFPAFCLAFVRPTDSRGNPWYVCQSWYSLNISTDCFLCTSWSDGQLQMWYVRSSGEPQSGHAWSSSLSASPLSSRCRFWSPPCISDSSCSSLPSASRMDIP